MAEKKGLPYELKAVEVSEKGELSATIVFDGTNSTVVLGKEMLFYVLDAGFRTRISAAMASKKGMAEKLKAAKASLAKLVSGIIGRVSQKAEAKKAALEESEKALRANLKDKGLAQDVIDLTVAAMLSAI